MPIGPVTPGSYVTVTPDVIGAPYTSLQAPTATMPVIGSDLQALTLWLLNIQDLVRQELADAFASLELAIATLEASLEAQIEALKNANSGKWQLGTPTVGITSGGSLPTWKANGALSFEQIDLTEPAIYIPLALPQGATISSVAVHLKGYVAHGPTLPDTMPLVYLSRLNPTAATLTQYGPVVDASANVAAYTTPHTIAFTPTGDLADPIDNETYIYYVALQGEMGANSEIGLYYGGTKVVFT